MPARASWPEEGGPFLSRLDEAARAVHRKALPDGPLLCLGGEGLELGAARERVDLVAARGLQAVDPHERLAHRLPDREQPVVAEDEEAPVAEVPDDARLLVRLGGGAFVVVVGGPAEDGERLLAVREEPLLLHRHRHPVARVGVHDVVQVRMVEVNRAVNDEPRLVHAEVRAAHHVPRPVHPDER